jgi:hypothetical protein
MTTQRLALGVVIAYAAWQLPNANTFAMGLASAILAHEVSRWWQRRQAQSTTADRLSRLALQWGRTCGRLRRRAL